MPLFLQRRHDNYSKVLQGVVPALLESGHPELRLPARGIRFRLDIAHAASTDVGKKAFVSYTADYFFFEADERY